MHDTALEGGSFIVVCRAISRRKFSSSRSPLYTEARVATLGDYLGVLFSTRLRFLVAHISRLLLALQMLKGWASVVCKEVDFTKGLYIRRILTTILGHSGKLVIT